MERPRRFKSMSGELSHSRLSKLAPGDKFIIWPKGHQKPLKGRLVRSQKRPYEENLSMLCLEVSSVDGIKMGQRGLLSFSLAGPLFFSKFSVTKIEGRETLYIRPDTELFQMENRLNERLLVYPHRMAFLYLPGSLLKDTEQNNVFSLFGRKDSSQKILQSLKEQTRPNAITSIFGSDSPISLRLVNLSCSGLSCLASSDENEGIRSLQGESKGVIEFEGNFFQIENIESVYSVKSLDPKLDGVILHRLGLKFKDKSGELAAFLNKGPKDEMDLFDFADIYNGL